MFDESRHASLPLEIEQCFPDYSIYPQYDFAVSMTSRGCPRRCGFCHVSKKEGCASVKVADVWDFWSGQEEIKVLDPNITACLDKRELMRQYVETGAWIDFTQGLDIRLLDDDDVADLNRMKIRGLHFAWDNPNDDLKASFERYASVAGKKTKSGAWGTVYILTNYEKCTVAEHIKRALYRIEAVDALNYDPYLMIYDKPHAAPELRNLQRWCNNKRIFKTVKRFQDYTG